MKKYIQYILVFLLLFTMTACNESSKANQEATAGNGFSVSVIAPQKNSAVNSKFFKTSADIVTVLLVVMDNYEDKENYLMSYDKETNAWSANFALNVENGPFNFRVDAYGVRQPSAATIPTFTGNVNFDPKTDTETAISIPLSDTVANINTRILPSLTSVEKLILNVDGTIVYKFNVVNKQGGVLNYYVSSFGEDGKLCENPFFAYPDSGITSIGEGRSSFKLNYAFQESCVNPVHRLTLTVEATQDAINIPIAINDQSFNIKLAFPPVIENTEITRLENSDYIFEVTVENSENLNLSYEWLVIKGTGVPISITDSPEKIRVSDYSLNAGLEVKVKVSDTASGASSSFIYVVLEKVLVKNSDGTIFDESTSLFWAKNTDVSSVPVTHNSPRTYCKDLAARDDEKYDWRLPTIEELVDVYPNDIFSKSNFLWSINNIESNKEAIDLSRPADEAWTINGVTGATTYVVSGSSGSVRCVVNSYKY